MKKILLILAVIGLGLTSCGKYSKKCKNAEIALEQANTELQQVGNIYVLNPTTENKSDFNRATMKFNEAVKRRNGCCD